jgi:hypothetical protein
MTLMLISGAWGMVIHEKSRSKKSQDNVPLNLNFLSGVYNTSECVEVRTLATSTQDINQTREDYTT